MIFKNETTSKEMRSMINISKGKGLIQLFHTQITILDEYNFRNLADITIFIFAISKSAKPLPYSFTTFAITPYKCHMKWVLQDLSVLGALIRKLERLALL